MNKKFWLPVIGLLTATSVCASDSYLSKEKLYSSKQASSPLLSDTGYFACMSKNGEALVKNQNLATQVKDKSRVEKFDEDKPQVYWDEWAGREIFDEIVSSQELPDDATLRQLKLLVESLRGGVSTLAIRLSNAWRFE